MDGIRHGHTQRGGRARLFGILALTLCCFMLRAEPETAGARPNILWLIAEDLGPHLGCDGTPESLTPNLDRLAAEGVRHTRFFTTSPVCSPSRSAFMTGMYQTTIGAHNHRSHRDDGFMLPEGVGLLTDWMRDAGYHTANVVELPEAFGFKGEGKTDWNFTPPARPFDSTRWDSLAAHEPFFAQINFQETHRAFRAPKRADPAKVALPPYLPDHPVVRADWAAYLDALTELDRKIGLVLARLESEGLAGRTIIVFFGDNGQAHVRGKQWCYDSGLRVPLIIRWARALPPPAGFVPGTFQDRLVSAIDLAPTMLDIAGAAVPPGMQGQVFLGARAAAPRTLIFGARDRCDETPFRIRTVRDARWRYIRNFTPEGPLLRPNEYMEKSYPAWNLLKELGAQGRLDPIQAALAAPRMPDEELYDTATDPHEVRNLAGDPRHAAELARLRLELDSWIKDSDDQGRFPEPREVEARRGATRPETNPMKGYRLDAAN